ncbi:MAG: Trk system potassium transporter TrkA [Dehalococcoidia bacterium]|nr:MAG: Trk system potassium transporter TrkA [Dehalococcoidia bacterium]
MYIVVVGAGAAGFYVASLLSKEKQEITVVEQDEEAAEQVRRALDVGVVIGNAAIPRVLWQAEVQRADLLVAVTGTDETNMITCFMAKELGAKKTIARVRNPEYSGYMLVGGKSPYATRKVVRPRSLGVDLFVNPEIEAAREIVSILSGLYVTPMEEFADGRVQLREFKAESAAVVGKRLLDIPFPRPCVVVMMEHGDELSVPSGDERVQKGDRLYLVATRKDMDELGAIFEVPRRSPRTVIVFGGGTIGFHVAESLEKRGIQVKLIEKSPSRAQEIGSKLKHTVVIQGGRPDRDLLVDEGLAHSDAFVAATGDESLNILAGLVAKGVGVSRNIVVVDEPEYIALAEAVGVDVAMSPLLVCGSRIAHYVLHGGAVSVALLGKEDAQVIEFLVGPNARISKCSVGELDWPKHAAIGAIVRGETVIAPTDATTLEPGDTVIVAALLDEIPNVERLFKAP